MRYRIKDKGRYIPQWGVYEGSECWDDPTRAGLRINKPCTMKRVRIIEDLGQSYSYYWYNSNWKTWYGPVQVSSSTRAVEGPNNFYGRTDTGNLTGPTVDTGFIFDAIDQYGKSDVGIGQFLAELRETVRMFKSPWDCAVAMSKGKIPKWIKNLPDAVNFVSRVYLGYRYGWKPFLNDVKGFTRLSSKLDQRYESDSLKNSPRTVRAFRTATQASSLVGKHAYVDGPAKLVAWRNLRTVETTRCEYCKVISNPSSEALSVAMKFVDFYRLGDIAEIAWDITPYSFIIDWFIPIGDEIHKHFSAPANVIAASGPWAWVRVKDNVKVSNTGLSNEAYRTTIKFAYEIESVSFVRDYVATFPPKPSKIDGWQKLDLALIAGQRLGSFLGKGFRRG